MAKRKRFYMLALLERINSPDWAEVKIPAETTKPLKKQDKILISTLPLFRLETDCDVACARRDERQFNKAAQARNCPVMEEWAKLDKKCVMVEKQNFPPCNKTLHRDVW